MQVIKNVFFKCVTFIIFNHCIYTTFFFSNLLAFFFIYWFVILVSVQQSETSRGCFLLTGVTTDVDGKSFVETGKLFSISLN